MRLTIAGALRAALPCALFALSACGEPEGGQEAASTPQESPARESAAELDALRGQAETAAYALFASTCGGLGATAEICGCVRDRVEDAAGISGVAYIGAAYGGQDDVAAQLEGALTKDERDAAAEAFIGGQFDCVMAVDPDYGDDATDGDDGPPPGTAGLPPTVFRPEPEPEPTLPPFEASVNACVEVGAAPEPVCQCRAEEVRDALGEDGLTLARAADAADEEALRSLAERLGQGWLAESAAVLSTARETCEG